MNEKLSFTVEDAKLIKEDPDSSFSTILLDFFASGDNLHHLYVSEETLKKTSNTIKNCPVVWKYDCFSDDIGTHDPEEVPCGVIPESSEIISKKLEDGRTMLSVLSIVWKKYSGKLLDFFKRDGDKPVSVELTVLDSKENEDGSEELTDYKFEAVTILGSRVKAAIPMARATVLQFAKEYEEEYAKEFSDKYSDIDFTIPKSVKNKAKKALESYKSHGTNANSASLSIARFLINNEKINPEKIRLMAKFFNKKTTPDDATSEFYGGEEGRVWMKKIKESIDEIDNRKSPYFSEGEIITFPYTSLKDAPKNMKEIDGVPLTLDQVNQIAKVADSIGVSKEKNGYAIAKSQFKKSHHIENNRWVKNKEDMSESETDDSDKEEIFVDKEDEVLNKDLVCSTENKAQETEDFEEEPKEEVPEIEEKDEEEETEEQEDKEEDKEEKMSLDGNLDVAAMLKILEAETEDYKYLVERNDSGNMDFQKLSTMLYAKLCEMSEKAEKDKEAYLAENEVLKGFKADIEAKQFAFEIEATLSEVSDTMPKDKIAEYREDSKNFSLENIDAWKNKVKAVAFSYTKDKKPSDGINRVAMPWLNSPKSESNFENGWL